MTAAPSRLPDLIALASEPSSTTRRTLLRELTDSFFGPTPHTETEIALYGDVMARLTADMEKAVRAELAQRFAPAPRAPAALVRRLAHDEAEVAAHVLRLSPVLTEEDLLSVVREHGQAHLRAVSERKVVPEAVSEVIVDRGDDETLGALLRNDGAVLSRAASEAACQRALSNPDLHAAAVERAALPADLRNDMYFLVEARLRQTIIEKNARLDPALVDQALSAGRVRVETADGLLPDDYADSRDYVDELRAAGQLTPPTLARFLRSGSRTAFLIALAQLADIDFHTAQGIVDRRELDALAVICRAADLDRALFLTFAVVLLDREENPIGRAQDYARLYNDLSPDTARRTVRFWRMRRIA